MDPNEKAAGCKVWVVVRLTPQVLQGSSCTAGVVGAYTTEGAATRLCDTMQRAHPYNTYSVRGVDVRGRT